MKRYNLILAITVLVALALGFVLPMTSPVSTEAGISEIVPANSSPIVNYRAVSNTEGSDLSDFVFIKQNQGTSERPEMAVTIIGCDPATGRSQEVNLTWEQLCISTTYEVHIDKSQSMNLPVLSCFITPYDVTSPSMILLAGGEGIGGGFVSNDLSSIWNSNVTAGVTTGLVPVPSLECGHTYYWRVRTRDEVTGDMVRSPWSAIGSFTVKAGFKVTSSYYGPQLLAPDNGCGCDCSSPIAFSWSPYVDTAAYKFELSTNADMSSPIVSTQVKNSTAYQWTGTPKCNTSYYWRVMATDPAPSEWSATFTFKTLSAPPAPAAAAPEPATPLWVWVVIGIGAILVIVTLVLVFATRRK